MNNYKIFIDHKFIVQLTRTSVLCMSIFILTSNIMVANSYSQTVRLSVKIDQLNLKDAIVEIKKQTEFDFLYSKDIEPLYNSNERVEVMNGTIEEVLNQLFKDSKIDYRIIDKTIVLVPKKSVPENMNVMQQGITVSGTVTDRGSPLPGVNISLKGTTTGEITDANGRYKITVPNRDAVLVFSFIGYTSQEITVGNQREISVAMNEDLREIDEVVVVGYGTLRKRDVTGSVATVSNELLTAQKAQNPTMALRGQVAGLDIRQSTGRAGGEAKIFIRGNSGIKKEVQPLVIIDDIPSGFSQLNDMDPNDIERIDILKDASSTAIYGSRAAGGVIIVSTRTGYEGKNVISYNESVGFKIITRAPKMMNSKQFEQFYNDGVAFRGQPTDNQISSDDREFIDAGINTDWLGMVTRTGFETKHNISMTGGNKNSNHYLSLGYAKEEGVQKPEAYDRYSVSTRISGKVLNKLTAGASIFGTYSIVNQAGNQDLLTMCYRLRPWGKPFDDEGNYRFFPTQNESLFTHPLANLENTKMQRNRAYVTAGAYLDFQPIEGLSIKTNFMPRINLERKGTYIGEKTSAKANKPGSSTAEAINQWGIGYLWENILTYNKRLGDHSIGATGLFSMENSRNENYQDNVTGLSYPGQLWYNNAASISINGVTSSMSIVSMISYMGRLNYGFKDKYLLTVTGRWDGSSKLAEGNQWGFFPSTAIAWRAGEENFIKNLDVFSNLKFRLSYGVSGLNDVDPYSSFATLKTTTYNYGSVSAKGASAVMANRALTWEKSHEYNLGIDMGFFNDRLNGAIEIYQRTTKGLILDRLIPSHQGVLQLKQNVGSVRNRGIELTINSVNIMKRNFTWQTNLNFASNINEILELYGDKVDDIGNKLFIGHPVSVEYDYDVIGVWQSGEETEALKYASKPGYLKVRDVNNDGKITPEGDKVILGSQFPKWTAGITNTFAYKGIDLSFFIYTRQKVMYRNGFLSDVAKDWSTRPNVPAFSYWTPTNPDNWYPSPGSPATYNEAWTYEDCTFWRLQHITLGYNFNKQKIKSVGFSNLRAYVQVLNPLVITKFHGWDPEYARETTGSAPLNGATFLFGVNVSL